MPFYRVYDSRTLYYYELLLEYTRNLDRWLCNAFMFLFLSRAAPPPNEEEQMEDDAPPLPKRQPLSLEDMIAKKEAEAQAQAKVSACHDIYLACFCVVLI